MAYKFENALEGHQSNLALFHPLPVDTGVESIQWIEYRPVSQLTHGSFVEFNVPPSSMEYLDLSKTRLHIKARIVKKSDGSPVTPEDKVGFINLALATLWRQVDVTLNQVNISPTTSTFYAHKSLLDVLLNHSEDSKESQMQCMGYFKDTGNMDSTDPIMDSNFGLTQRFVWSKDGNSVDLEGQIFADVMMQQRLILNGVQLNVKLFPSSNEFALMSATNDYKIELTDAILKVCQNRVNPSIIIGHDNALSTSNAIYPYIRSNIKTFSVAAGLQSFSADDLWQGELPTRVVIAMTSSAAFNGTINRNPFNFEHMYTNFIAMYVDGESKPATPLTPNFKTNNFTAEYLSLFSGTGKLNKNDGNFITKEEFAKGYAIFIIDLDSNHSDDYVSLSRRGHSRLVLRFQESLTEPICVIAYGMFNSNFQIDKARNIIIS